MTRTFLHGSKLARASSIIGATVDLEVSNIGSTSIQEVLQRPFVAEIMHLLARADHAGSEILVEHAKSDRLAEREGRYEMAFATANPN